MAIKVCSIQCAGRVQLFGCRCKRSVYTLSRASPFFFFRPFVAEIQVMWSLCSSYPRDWDFLYHTEYLILLRGWSGYGCARLYASNIICIGATGTVASPPPSSPPALVDARSAIIMLMWPNSSCWYGGWRGVCVYVVIALPSILFSLPLSFAELFTSPAYIN